jgi:hypothetical protein
LVVLGEGKGPEAVDLQLEDVIVGVKWRRTAGKQDAT